MPPPKQPTRAQQPSTSGFGKTFTTPIKHRDRVKTSTYVQPWGQKEEMARLRVKIEKLKQQVIDEVELPAPIATKPDLLWIQEPNLLIDSILILPVDNSSNSFIDNSPDPFIDNTLGGTTQDEQHIPRH
ncbi:hypothetical protein J132_10296 [Termitomyces sp. J132]|nr:hypothetical protein H2248_003480 [Termitomyces sp. 'cryptogamus']KNZ76490.1 hypothetical protein J132_10296 [Termitomyces sp. J132]